MLNSLFFHLEMNLSLRGR